MRTWKENFKVLSDINVITYPSATITFEKKAKSKFFNPESGKFYNYSGKTEHDEFSLFKNFKI